MRIPCAYLNIGRLRLVGRQLQQPNRKDVKLQRAFFDDIARNKGFDAATTPDCWYSVTHKDVVSKKVGITLISAFSYVEGRGKNIGILWKITH